jgi:hypothetical protein
VGHVSTSGRIKESIEGAGQLRAGREVRGAGAVEQQTLVGVLIEEEQFVGMGDVIGQRLVRDPVRRYGREQAAVGGQPGPSVANRVDRDAEELPAASQPGPFDGAGGRDDVRGVQL